jgi:hypothetical protein
MFSIDDLTAAIHYMDSRNFTEPMFVLAIMVIAGTRPILQTAMVAIHSVPRIIPFLKGRSRMKASAAEKTDE